MDKLLFAAVLVLCAVVALTALAPATGIGGTGHPEHATMRHGGPGDERHGDMLWTGWLFGVAVFLVFAALIAFGARHHIGDFGRWLTLALIAVISAWSWLVYAYRGYLDDPAPELYLALPAPTAIMVYLFWPLTMGCVLFFVLGFRRWVLSDEDFETYQDLIERHRQPADDEP